MYNSLNFRLAEGGKHVLTAAFSICNPSHLYFWHDIKDDDNVMSKPASGYVNKEYVYMSETFAMK
jgi:hypothetical protein